MSKRKYSTQQLFKRTFTATFKAIDDDFVNKKECVQSENNL